MGWNIYIKQAGGIVTWANRTTDDILSLNVEMDNGVVIDLPMSLEDLSNVTGMINAIVRDEWHERNHGGDIRMKFDDILRFEDDVTEYD